MPVAFTISTWLSSASSLVLVLQQAPRLPKPQERRAPRRRRKRRVHPEQAARRSAAHKTLVARPCRAPWTHNSPVSTRAHLSPCWTRQRRLRLRAAQPAVTELSPGRAGAATCDSTPASHSASDYPLLQPRGQGHESSSAKRGSVAPPCRQPAPSATSSALLQAAPLL